MSGRWLVTLLIGGLCGVWAVEGARILAVFPFPAKSHQAVFLPLLRELGRRGHQITAYIPQSLPNPPPGYKEVILPNLFLDLLGMVDVTQFGQQSALEQVVVLHEIGLFVQKKLCEVELFKQLINSEEQFDAIIMETLFVQEGLSALQHKFGAVPIEIMPLADSAWINEVVGNPHNPSYALDFKSPFTDKMDFVQRLSNTLVSVGTNLIGYLYYVPKTQALVDECYRYKGWEERPPIKQLMSNKSLVLLNTHFTINYPYPKSPHVIEVAGIHIGPNKPLPKDLQTFMDGAKEGVVYFSLGSNMNVSDIAKDNMFHAFKGAFGKLKQKVLWKWEKDDFPGKPDNVKTSAWFPQQDILAHKNCKLFVTHGGFLSVTEAVNFGVPLVGIPFFGDQAKNMKQVASREYGLQLDPGHITEESVSWAINEVLSNPKYMKAVKERSAIYRDQPRPALDKAVYWVEYVIRHRGAPHLRTALSELPWYQALMLDVLAVIGLAVFLFFLLLYLMVRKVLTTLRDLCCRWGRKKQPQPTSKDKKAKKKTN